MVATKQLASALVIVAAIAGPASAQTCTPAQECGDVNESSSVTAGDALAVLKRAVGLDIALMCSCDGGTLCEAGGTVQTGQTQCWDPLDTTIPIDPIDCVATGQDGEYQKGLLSAYTDNGDGTVTDERTTLMWEKLSNDGSIHDYDDVAYHWAGAFKKIEDLNETAFGGYSDWRLPNARELATLTDFSAYNPAVDPVFNNKCVPGCAVTPCPGCPNADCSCPADTDCRLCTVPDCSCTNDAYYWSSTTYQFTPQNAWSLDGKTGSMAVTKAKWTASPPTLYVRAVRGGY